MPVTLDENRCTFTHAFIESYLHSCMPAHSIIGTGLIMLSPAAAMSQQTELWQTTSTAASPLDVDLALSLAYVSACVAPLSPGAGCRLPMDGSPPADRQVTRAASHSAQAAVQGVQQGTQA